MFALRQALFLLYASHLAVAHLDTNADVCAENECPQYDVVETTALIEVRRYSSGTWITWQEKSETTSFADFAFLVEFTDHLLRNYFAGKNYGQRKLKTTKPLKVDLDIYHLEKPRKVSCPILTTTQDDIAAPFVPLFIERTPERYVYVRKIPVDLTASEILYAASEFMTELALRRFPFDKNDVSIALFSHPSISSEEVAVAEYNEIWIGRTYRRSSSSDYFAGGSYTPGGYAAPLQAVSDTYRSAYLAGGGLTSSGGTRSGGQYSAMGRRGGFGSYSASGGGGKNNLNDYQQDQNFVLGRKSFIRSYGNLDPDESPHPIVILQKKDSV